MYIQQYVQWKNNEVWLNNQLICQSGETDPLQVCTDIYRQIKGSYPKFFKMDLLSKAAYITASLTLPQEPVDAKQHIAVVLGSNSGSLDVDKKFDDSRNTVASPALFVYTLPNIMLGEICIAYGFKGEQMCALSPGPDAEWTSFYVADLLTRRHSQAVLCGYVEATATGIAAAMAWVTRIPSTLPFNQVNLQNIFGKIK